MSTKILPAEAGGTEYELLRELTVAALRAGLAGLPTTPPTHYVAIIGEQRILCTAEVAERYRKFYGRSWPVHFEPVTE